MAIRVATFNTSHRILAETIRTQAHLSQLQIQQATNKVSTDYGGLGSSAGQLLNLEVSKARAQSYADAASLSGNRVQVMYSTCGALVDVLTSLRAKISQASGSLDSVGAKAIQEEAANLLKEAVMLMNKRDAGRYVFSGEAVDTVPVDDTKLPAVEPVPISTSTAYYDGGNTPPAVRLSSEEVLTYGYLASDPAFQKTLHVLNLVATVDISSDKTAAAEANSAVLDAIGEMTNVQTMLSLHAQTLERSRQQWLDSVDTADAMASEVGEVDIAQVQASLSTYTAQLQASFSAIAKISNLKLVDYIR
jgi:flagellar hook-associated protein 3 FlgL